jgi:hypothetical protein
MGMEAAWACAVDRATGAADSTKRFFLSFRRPPPPPPGPNPVSLPTSLSFSFPLVILLHSTAGSFRYGDDVLFDSFQANNEKGKPNLLFWLIRFG